MRRVLEMAAQELREGRPVVLAAVVEARGSVPQKEGAVMLVGAGGLLAGTIGGGALEHRCVQLAAGLFAGGQSRIEDFSLSDAQAGELGMVCGGNVKVLLVPLRQKDALFSTAGVWPGEEGGRLCLPLDGSAPFIEKGERGRRPVLTEWDGTRRLEIPLDSEGRVFIIGGGHVARELSSLLTQLEIRHVVVDDRKEFAVHERFPGAEQVLESSFANLESILQGPLYPGKGDGFCIMTRGHEGDLDALRFALSTRAEYIGVMGSRRKRERLFSQLEAEGFQNVYSRVTLPIGLEIGARTPAEIAVSVAAQLIRWRAEEEEKTR